ncbi:MAG: hypothetical protein AAB914_02515 [Patescibacteria group bacterium]
MTKKLKNIKKVWIFTFTFASLLVTLTLFVQSPFESGGTTDFGEKIYGVPFSARIVFPSAVGSTPECNTTTRMLCGGVLQCDYTPCTEEDQQHDNKIIKNTKSEFYINKQHLIVNSIFWLGISYLSILILRKKYAYFRD